MRITDFLLASVVLAAGCSEPSDSTPPTPADPQPVDESTAAAGSADSVSKQAAESAAESASVAGRPGWPPAEAKPTANERLTWMVDAPGDWWHLSSPTPEMRMPEVVCGGVVIFDYDLDEDLDVFLVQGGVWQDLDPSAVYPGHALFRNDGDWKFVNVAREAGLFGVPSCYGMGAVSADYDNDGDPDLYVTAFEENFLYQNQGDGTFVDVTEGAGISGGKVWSASACWLDGDQDGWLDLYVVNYVNYTHEENLRKPCGMGITGIRDYCSPREFVGMQDFYFRNQGDGSFQEIASEIGLKSPQPLKRESKGLGVVSSDLNDDGDPDLYVANDSTANLLFLNQGGGQFREQGLIAGCAYSDDGQAQAGMGTDAADFDRDGDMDLWVVHLDLETNALYRNDGRAFFSDDHHAAGLEAPAAGQVGFGTAFFDHDNDTDLDLVIANGHVLIHVDKSRGTLHYRQQDQLFENNGEGVFSLLDPQQAGSYFGRRNAGRGLATGDLDHDGDLDVVISVRDEPPTFLRNNYVEQGGTNHGLRLRLQGSKGNRDALGARVTVQVGERSLVAEVRAGSSYCSCHDLSLHFGLGDASAADQVSVRWPGGQEEQFGKVEGGFSYRLIQGEGLRQARPFRP
jgi:hypothetical protein